MKRITILTVVFIILIAVSLHSQSIPTTINYQGILKDGSGVVVPNGDYNITFRLYDAATGSSALWSETKLISVTNGIVNTKLGSNTPIVLPFDAAYWLGVTIGTESELTPRVELTTVPYSYMSMSVPDGSLTSEKISAGQIVKSINTLKDDVNLVAGTNITLTPSGNNITIEAAGGTGGTVTQVNTGAGLTGGPITTTGTLSIPNDGITSAMLQNNSVTSEKISDGTITGTDIANSTISADKLSFTPGTVTSVATGSGLTGGPITTTGTISISTGGITSAMILDNTLSSADILDGTVAAADLANNSVTSAKILDGTILTADFGDNSVTSGKIVDGTITSADIGATQVVKAVNNIKDNVTLIAGTNVTITPSGQNLTISSTAGGIGGTGTTNYITKFSTANTIGNSSIYQSAAGNIGINTTNPNEPLDVNGDIELGTTQTIKLRSKIGPSGNYGLTINTDDLEYYSFDRLGTATFTGKLGIGTAPQCPLHVAGNNTTALIYSVNTAGTSGSLAAGVYGQSNTADYYGVGGLFVGGWYGVYGSVTPTGNNSYFGVYGSVSGGTSPAGARYGVYGISQGIGTGGRYGLRGAADGGGSNYGLYATATGGTTSYGLYAAASGGTINYAGYFGGNVNVTGTISKGGGSFKIDHPLDPTNKYLYHSFVESPDMMNIYNGNVITDGSGYAKVTMPDWFEALNKDFRYQLTVIGDFAQAIIAQKVQGNQFAIRTDKPNIEVSWQVTGIRKDAFAEKNRIPIEEMKKGDEVGKYIHPEVYGLPETMSIDYEKHKGPEERQLER